MHIISGEILHCRWKNSKLELDHVKDGAFAIDKAGIICAKASLGSLKTQYPEASLIDYSGKLILPGFLDTHIHFPQMDMIGQMAPSLLPWLQQYTFPTEISFHRSRHLITKAAHHFVDELLNHGTTLACVYSSSHMEVTDALFEVFAERGLRGIIGKTSMDRHAPAPLLVPEQQDLLEQITLLERWHGYDQRLSLALTPRFAPSCTPDLMHELGRMHQEYPDTYIQTHYAENTAELEWIKQLFPKAKDYLEVYESFDLAGSRTILAHGIHVDADSLKRLAARKILISHCPTSNLFLGSGLFDWQAMDSQAVAVGLGTDVGAGTSFSLWQTMNEAHKVAALRGCAIAPIETFAAATIKAGIALGFDDLGCLDVGYQADFQVIDSSQRPILDRRRNSCTSSTELLSALIHLSDDRCVESVWVKGNKIR